VTIAELNALPAVAAREAFERCCGASRWIGAMVAARPFADRATLFAAAEWGFTPLDRPDWLEAFAHHPKIGDVSTLRAKFASTAAWAASEQRGATAAAEATLEALAEGNRAYEQRFGYIFIVCATGKSAEEMLGLLRARLGNAPDRELEIAAGEQKKITKLRLEKLLDDSGGEAR
jgi:2-oxo-4-hydroxy-4-carboxy-5-ureidoimidazoline decarboxylase